MFRASIQLIFLFSAFTLVFILSNCENGNSNVSNRKDTISIEEKIEMNQGEMIFLSFWDRMTEKEFKSVSNKLYLSQKIDKINGEYFYVFDVSNRGLTKEFKAFIKPDFGYDDALFAIELELKPTGNCTAFITTKNDIPCFYEEINEITEIYNKKYGAPRIKEDSNEEWIFGTNIEQVLSYPSKGGRKVKIEIVKRESAILDKNGQFVSAKGGGQFVTEYRIKYMTPSNFEYEQSKEKEIELKQRNKKLEKKRQTFDDI